MKTKKILFNAITTRRIIKTIVVVLCCFFLISWWSSNTLSQSKFREKSGKAQETMKSKIVINGTLVRKDNSPVVGKEVFLLLVKNKKPTLSVEEGKIVNPSGRSDQKGRFIIEVNRAFLLNSSEFTIGIGDAFFNIKSLRQHDVSVIFDIDKKTTRKTHEQSDKACCSGGNDGRKDGNLYKWYRPI